MEIPPIESVCLDYISNCLYLQLTPVLSNITWLSFHSLIRKWIKELPNRYWLLLNVCNVSSLTAVHDILQGHTQTWLVMFPQWRQNVKSLYFKLLTLSLLMPLTFQFTLSLWSCLKYHISSLLTVLDIIYSSSNIAKNWTFYIFLTALCANCFGTVCPVHL